MQPGYVEINNGVFSWGNSRAEKDKSVKAGPPDKSAKGKAAGKPNGKGGKDDKTSKGKNGKNGKGKGKNGKGSTEDKSPNQEEESTKAPKDEKPALEDINLKCLPGTLTMVVGAVGSGKSSLLATLFQQISRLQGTVKVPHPSDGYPCCIFSM